MGLAMTDRKPPSYTGLFAHREPEFGCSLLIPLGWQRLELDSEVGSGTIFVPDPEDVVNSFSFEGRKLGMPVNRRDLRPLEEGMLAGLRSMPESAIESHEAEAVGGLITMEARHTYRDGEATRKRWVRLLYQGEVQVRLIAQGSSPEEFAYWEPMFFQMMRTFRFGFWGEELFASDFKELQEGTSEPGS
jgi:hypothetical protein